MKEEGTIKPLHCFPSSTAHNQQTLWKGYIGVTIELRIKFGRYIKKVRGTTPSPSQTKIIRIMSVLS